MKDQSSLMRFTAGRVADFTCPTNKSQAFLWDTDAPTLALRATPTGRKTYVFESRLNGATIRITIGTMLDWPLGDARTKAQELKRLTDAGTDPREVESYAREQLEMRPATDRDELIVPDGETVSAIPMAKAVPLVPPSIPDPAEVAP